MRREKSERAGEAGCSNYKKFEKRTGGKLFQGSGCSVQDSSHRVVIKRQVHKHRQVQVRGDEITLVFRKRKKRGGSKGKGACWFRRKLKILGYRLWSAVEGRDDVKPGGKGEVGKGSVVVPARGLHG